MKPLHTQAMWPPRTQPGFSLVELTIVMLVVSILLAGVMMPLAMQMDVRRYADTKKTMDQINEALIGFVLVNGRLPCPASATVADGTAGAGTELLSGNVCTSYTGVIPWVTLNVPETDEWGGRFSYRVSSAFADAYASLTWGCAPPVAPASPMSFALCANGDMKVQSRSMTTSPPKTAYDLTSAVLPAVFISHGKNAYGAYGSQGTLLHAVPAANADETANATAGATVFFSRERTDVTTGCSDTGGSNPMCEFDDLVSFVPLTTLMNRMVVAGKLP
jgi:prepilin-type N-terminal cleavage/methylation domain-containing protein